MNEPDQPQYSATLVKWSLAPKFGTDKLPETFVLDRRGHIVAISRGEASQAFLNHAVARAEEAA